MSKVYSLNEVIEGLLSELTDKAELEIRYIKLKERYEENKQKLTQQGEDINNSALLVEKLILKNREQEQTIKQLSKYINELENIYLDELKELLSLPGDNLGGGFSYD